ncbi:MAG: hypothetical protein OEM77_00535 [Nitrosopumilus sp.]|nr:hypothetical protein [Nitrosopumilus sp.]MDH3737145.1 hypothetical protein [Nitrosopumilus sp.]MDH3823083.1 hypothetical protein [Nitrosopumilus sp.]MDH3833601.1 hypothetical protein [Nitrosopumilus sp.]
MRLGLFVLSLLVVFVLGSGSFAFAQATHTIVIPSGASDPEAPYFWSEQTTGITTGEIMVYPNDSITWKNADTAPHTVTSVTQSGEIDGVFDSIFLVPVSLILDSLQNLVIFTISAAFILG